MNRWLVVAIIMVISRLLMGTGEATVNEGCTSQSVPAAAVPIDFLFASTQDWKRFEQESWLEGRR